MPARAPALSSRGAPVDFLGIGAQKAGTTWLWSMLRAHPRIWMPPRKELHYFDRSPAYLTPNLLATDSLIERLLSRAPHNCAFRRRCWTHLRYAFGRRDWPRLRWDLRYYLGSYGDEWYLSLFKEGAGRVRGEITPAYALLDGEDVARIAHLLPRVKIIFLLRNPIERAWSQIRFEWTRGRFAGIDDLARVREFIDDPFQSLRSDYLRTLDIWEARFPREQMLVGFFDDITARPAELLNEVLGFLGVEPNGSGLRESKLRQKVHTSKEADMPHEVRVHLAAKYLPDLEKLSARFGGHAERWRAEAAALR